MKKNLRLPLLGGLLIGIAALIPFPLLAQQMNYQGRLTDTLGNALADGQYTLTFNLYTAATGGTAIWGPFVCDGDVATGHAAKADLVNGRFNVILGSVDAASRSLTAAFAGREALFLGIKIGSTGPEISPRQQMLAAPEAIRARIADTVVDGGIGTAQLADGSVTAAKISGGTGVWLATPSGTNIFRGQGNVGIGTATPQTKLEVAGTVSAQDFVGPGANPPGAIIAYGGATAPAGWILCNGQAISRTEFSRLFTAIGTAFGPGNNSTTFNVPDLRGLFLRGRDGGRGADPDRDSRQSLNGGNSGDNVGSYQGDLFRAHIHTFVGNTVSRGGNGGTGRDLAVGDSFDFQTYTPSGTISQTGGNETRPQNLSVNYIIRY